MVGSRQRGFDVRDDFNMFADLARRRAPAASLSAPRLTGDPLDALP
jgi:hypothetical protein